MRRSELVVTLIVLGSVMAYCMFNYGRTGKAIHKEQQDWRAMCTRMVAVEREIAGLRSRMDEMENMMMLGSAQLDRRIAKIEVGTRPVINIGRATVWNADGEIVMEER